MPTNNLSSNKRLAIKRSIKSLSIAGAILLTVVGSQYIQMTPFHAFGGAVWAKDGFHYIDDAQISERVKEINAPNEAKLAESISQSTPSCNTLDGGFCQQSPGVFAVKILVTPAIEYVAAIPDKKIVTGYCTLCRDGTFSPSCAVGRGACSYHSGVSAYNVASYRTIPGAPAVQAQPAAFTYDPKTYQDSADYVKPETPSLPIIVNTPN